MQLTACTVIALASLASVAATPLAKRDPWAPVIILPNEKTASVAASRPSKMDIWSPPIILPNENTVWRIGDLVNVTWDNSNPPQDFTDPCVIQLNDPVTGPIPPEKYGVLSSGFDLKLGWAEVDVPWYGIEPGEYTITLFGDDSNRSPVFRIIAREEKV
ncbi:hypothetical protein Moror_7726 [Moniliophthora roreri MCA 2997]|uniref:Uncharacterized protein n=2 Tax=Moniliophthora roreri TaxID=221103 RepID=V2X901_MONRO|nr:hypothetical protein Moror_7726 [Moniliophthora roreri MCA 2997]KAI3615148.1 hypothetical protein WG66_003550 [Moniliophthora roreri]